MLESMACGHAIVILGKLQPAMNEVLGGYGLIAKDIDQFKSMLNKLCISQDMREEYGGLAYMRAKQFSLDRMVNQWNELLMD